MTVYNFNGLVDGQSTGNFVFGGDNPDLVNITYGEGFFTTNIRNEGTNVVIETSLGGTFLMQGVVIDQLTNANFAMNGDGNVDIGTNGPNTLTGNIVVGKGGNDHITGTPDDDFLAGNAGDDDIYGGGGMDRIRGGQGTDDIYEFGRGSIVYGDKGGDNIYAGSFTNEDDDDTGVTIFGGSGDPNDPLDGDDYIEASSYDDTLQGNGGDDEIYGYGGDDDIRGGKGDDIELNGGSGDDWVRGDKGDDYVAGWSGDDRLEGGAGDDDIEGGRGADVMSGGSGEDGFRFEYEGNQSVIDDIGIENLTDTEAVLDIQAVNFGVPQLANLDWITDLNLGGEGEDGVDHLYFEGWTDGGVHTVDNVSASNVADLLAIYTPFTAGGDDDAVLIHVDGGAFSGKSFLLVETTGGTFPEYLVQVTGVTGDFDDGDISGYPMA
jgi:Ca2+-binding RTX toxin-like protein